MIYFVTGNKNKFEEAKGVLPELEQLDLDLPEIQEIDATMIVKAKLEEAFKHHDGPFIVEDTSLYIDGLKGLPGPLIKWFLKTVGIQGLHHLAEHSGNVVHGWRRGKRGAPAAGRPGANQLLSGL